MEVHTKTKVGPLVNQLKKEGGNQKIQNQAKNLLSTWKKLQQAQSKAIPSGNTSSAAPTRVPSPAVENAPDVSRAQSDRSDEDAHIRNLPEKRLNMFEKIKAIFLEVTGEQIAAPLAVGIEYAIDEKFPFAKDETKKREYLLKAREITFSLKNNTVSFVDTCI